MRPLMFSGSFSGSWDHGRLWIRTGLAGTFDVGWVVVVAARVKLEPLTMDVVELKKREPIGTS